MTLVNVYVPNEDNPAFFRNVRDKLCYFECDFVVFGGDFNLVCNLSKDKKGGVATTHLKSKDEVRLSEKISNWLIFPLRFLVISLTLCPEITEADIVPGYRTDHC